MMDDIRRNLRYPETALQDELEGKVYVEFVVGKTGRVGNTKIKRGVHAGLDRDCVRIIPGMPEWIPAMNNGKPWNSVLCCPLVLSRNNVLGRFLPGGTFSLFLFHTAMKKTVLALLVLMGAPFALGAQDFSLGELPMANAADFPGGAAGLRQYIRDNTCYPAKALLNREEGKVFVEFMIDSVGVVSNVKLRAGVCSDIDSLCLAMVRNMPRWKASGERYRQYMLPISFHLYYKGTGTHYPLACDEKKKALPVKPRE